MRGVRKRRERLGAHPRREETSKRSKTLATHVYAFTYGIFNEFYESVLCSFVRPFLILEGGHEVETEEESKCDDAQNQRSQEAPNRKAGPHEKQ